MVISCLYVQTVTRQCFCFPNSQWGVTAHDTSQSTNKEQGKKSKFGPQPKFDSHNFNFKKELDRLPFPLNIGEVDLSKLQQQ